MFHGSDVLIMTTAGSCCRNAIMSCNVLARKQLDVTSRKKLDSSCVFSLQRSEAPIKNGRVDPESNCPNINKQKHCNSSI